MKTGRMENLIRLRKQNGWTQEFVAQKLGISKNTYCRYENGSCEPSLTILKKMATLFGCSLDYLAGISRKTPASQASINDIKKAKACLEDALKHLSQQADD